MYKKIWIIVISVILILTFSGSIIAKEVSIKPGNFTWNLQEDPLILVYFTTGQKIKGLDDKFFEELSKTLLMSIWGRPSIESMLTVKNGLQRLMNSHTIFLIHPKDIKYLQDLEAEHPNLLPLSCSKLKSYAFPLLYFSRNVQTDEIRGVIIADEVDSSLARLLTKEELPLDMPLQYEKGKLKEIKKK